MVNVLVALIMVAVSSAQAEEKLTGKQVLQRMVNAMETSDYQGTVVFLKNEKLEAMKYYHSLQNNHIHERLVSLNSPQREIVRKYDEVSCLFKATKRLIVDRRPFQHSFIIDVPDNINELENSYNFELTGEEDVAMMPTFIIAIQPKDEFRYSRKVWITKEHFLPVKAVIYDSPGEILEQVVFTDMQVNKPATLEAESKPSEIKAFPPAPITTKDEHIGFSASALPPGFKQIFFTRKPLHEAGQPVDHLILSDGLASVSVYVESKKPTSSPDSHIPEGIHSVGAINSISRNINNSQVTVLGEVPAASVKMIVEGIGLHPVE